jgi:outer membrane protein OmpA-like peptidoglycan-associated protein
MRTIDSKHGLRGMWQPAWVSMVLLGVLGLFQVALATDFSLRLVFKTHQASILVSGDRVCTWEKQGGLKINLAKSCRVTLYRDEIVVDIEGFELGDYEVEVIAGNEAQAEDYRVEVAVPSTGDGAGTSELELRADYPELSYVHEKMDEKIEFTVSVGGVETEVAKIESVAMVETSTQTVGRTRTMERIGKGLYTLAFVPHQVCGNHKFVATARGTLKADKGAFTRSVTYDIDVGGPGCQQEPSGPELLEYTVLFGKDSAKLDDLALRKTEIRNRTEHLAQWIKEESKGKDHRLMIVAFASQERDDEAHAIHNMKLSQRRGGSVLKNLRKLQKAHPNLVGNIECRAYGHQVAASHNETEAGRIANRRVKVILVPRRSQMPDFEAKWAGMSEACKPTKRRKKRRQKSKRPSGAQTP